MVINCCTPDPDGKVKQILEEKPDEKTKEEFLKNNSLLGEKAKEEWIKNNFPTPPTKSPSITDMLGGPSTMAMLAPILSGVTKMISTMPNKNKLEGNIGGGNFSIEIVDEQTRNIAMSILTNMTFDKPKKSKKKSN